jgi:hypothetical protein
MKFTNHHYQRTSLAPSEIKTRPIRLEAITKDSFNVCEKALPMNGESCAVTFLRMLILHQYFQTDSLEQRN